MALNCKSLPEQVADKLLIILKEIIYRLVQKSQMNTNWEMY